MLNLPQITFQTAVEGFEKGDPILPDFGVKLALQDVLQGRDAELEYAFELIEKTAHWATDCSMNSRHYKTKHKIIKWQSN